MADEKPKVSEGEAAGRHAGFGVADRGREGEQPWCYRAGSCAPFSSPLPPWFLSGGQEGRKKGCRAEGGGVAFFSSLEVERLPSLSTGRAALSLSPLPPFLLRGEQSGALVPHVLGAIRSLLEWADPEGLFVWLRACLPACRPPGLVGLPEWCSPAFLPRGSEWAAGGPALPLLRLLLNAISEAPKSWLLRRPIRQDLLLPGTSLPLKAVEWSNIVKGSKNVWSLVVVVKCVFKRRPGKPWS